MEFSGRTGSFWGAKHRTGSGTSTHGDPVVQILAHNNIRYLIATSIQACANGLVNILAGVDDFGNPLGGSIVKMIVTNSISGDGGAVNIAADGFINSLTAGSISSGSGTVKVAAAQDMTVSVGHVQSLHANGVQFAAGGAVHVYGLAHDRFRQSSAVDFPLQDGKAFQHIIKDRGFVEEHDLHGLVVTTQL